MRSKIFKGCKIYGSIFLIHETDNEEGKFSLDFFFFKKKIIPLLKEHTVLLLLNRKLCIPTKTKKSLQGCHSKIGENILLLEPVKT